MCLISVLIGRVTSLLRHTYGQSACSVRVTSSTHPLRLFDHIFQSNQLMQWPIYTVHSLFLPRTDWIGIAIPVPGYRKGTNYTILVVIPQAPVYRIIISNCTISAGVTWVPAPEFYLALLPVLRPVSRYRHHAPAHSLPRLQVSIDNLIVPTAFRYRISKSPPRLRRNARGRAQGRSQGRQGVHDPQDKFWRYF